MASWTDGRGAADDDRLLLPGPLGPPRRVARPLPAEPLPDPRGAGRERAPPRGAVLRPPLPWRRARRLERPGDDHVSRLGGHPRPLGPRHRRAAVPGPGAVQGRGAAAIRAARRALGRAARRAEPERGARRLIEPPTLDNDERPTPDEVVRRDPLEPLQPLEERSPHARTPPVPEPLEQRVLVPV